MQTAKLTLEIPYHDIGLFVASLSLPMRKRMLSLLSESFNIEISNMENGKTRKRMCKRMQLKLTPKTLHQQTTLTTTQKEIAIIEIPKAPEKLFESNPRANIDHVITENDFTQVAPG